MENSNILCTRASAVVRHSLVGHGAATRLRDLQPGALFELLRTGIQYRFLRRDMSTPGGAKYVVRRHGFSEEVSLHYSCHVREVRP